jgi:hypothetical protein
MFDLTSLILHMKKLRHREVASLLGSQTEEGQAEGLGHPASPVNPQSPGSRKTSRPAQEEAR